MAFIQESLSMAIRNVRQHKGRNALNVLGIVIGIASVVALVSTGIGAQDFINGQLGSLGGNKILISTASTSSFGPPSGSLKIDDSDLRVVKGTSGIEVAAGISVSSMPVKFSNDVTVASVTGVDPKDTQKVFEDVQGFQIGSGRFLKSSDTDSVVVGPVIATKTFQKDVKVGDKIDLNGKSFKVVGITQESGQQYNDNIVLIPIDSLRSITGDTSKSYSFLIAGVNNINDLQKIADQLQKKFDQLHGKKSFSILTTSQLASNIGQITSGFSFLLSGIAGISLIVAAVGISNTMLISVLERTRDIGIMKSIGATNFNIVEIFITESAIIGLIGGIVGVALGYLVSEIINGASGSFGLTLRTSVPLYLAVGGVVMSVGVGVASGLWPAIRASRLNPVEALRYE